MRLSKAIIQTRLVLFLLPCWLLVSFYLPAQTKLWKAGIATQNITPGTPIWMGGYAARDRPAEGTMHDLWAKALAIEDSLGKQAVFVSTDLLGLPRSISDAVFKKIKDKHNLERSQLMLTSSHTHSGPALNRNLELAYPYDAEQKKQVDEYTTWLERRLVDVISMALDQLEPAQVYTGFGSSRLAVNRRNNSEQDIDIATELRGPIDHAVPVIKVQRPDGDPMAILFGYACHATTLDSYQWSGDYPGFAQIEIEKRQPGAKALFFSGCGGDINPIPRRTEGLAKQYGSELASAVVRVLEDSMTALSPVLLTGYDELDLEFAPPPNDEELQTIAESEVEYYQRWARYWLERKASGQAIPTSYAHFPVQSWQLGHQTWVALGGEVVVDYAIYLKRLLGQDLIVTAYANDVMAYIPSLRVLREGGYEGNTSMRAYGQPSTWAPEVELRILQEVHRQVTALRSQRLRN